MRSTETDDDARDACVSAVTSASPQARADLGWALGTVFRGYVEAMKTIVGDIPGGPRGFEVLVTAARNCPPNQLRLAQQLGIDKTVMTYLLDDLEGAGLVERRPDPTDRRARQVTVTDAGRERLATLEAALRQAEQVVLAPLSEAEQGTLRGLLLKVAVAGPGVDEPGDCAVAEELVAAAPARR